MKILIVTNTLSPTVGGWGRYSFDVVTELKKRGHSIIVICNEVRPTELDILQVKLLPSPINFLRNFLFGWLYALRFFFFNRKNLRDIDIVHCFVEPYAFFTFILSNLLKVRYILTIHGSYGIKTLSHSVYRQLQIVSYKKAKAIICVSNYTKKRLLSWSKLDNLKVINNGISQDFSKNIITKEQEENSIIGVGALKERKGFHLVLKALSEVKKKIPNIKYYIVGDQHDTEYVLSLKEIIEKNDLKGNVFFFEGVTDEQLNKLYERSKLLVLTPVSSEFDFEGFGLVYLEANAHGLPVIGSFDNGGEDAIKDGYTGILTHSSGLISISNAIELLLTDKDLYANMSYNAFDWAKQMLWRKKVADYITIYNS